MGWGSTYTYIRPNCYPKRCWVTCRPRWPRWPTWCSRRPPRPCRPRWARWASLNINLKRHRPRPQAGRGWVIHGKALIHIFSRWRGYISGRKCLAPVCRGSQSATTHAPARGRGRGCVAVVDRTIHDEAVTALGTLVALWPRDLALRASRTCGASRTLRPSRTTSRASRTLRPRWPC